MYKHVRSSGKDVSRSVSSKRSYLNSTRVSSGAAGPCVSLVTGEVVKPTKIVELNPPKRKRRKKRRKKRRVKLIFNGGFTQ